MLGRSARLLARRLCTASDAARDGAAASAAAAMREETAGTSGGEGEGESTHFGFREVPVGEKRGLVSEVFAAVAPQYDLMNDLMSAGLHRLWKDRLVETLRPAPGQVHLDVAGGTGDVAFRVLAAMRREERVSRLAGRPEPAQGPGTVVVADINGAMLAEGRKRADAAGLSSAEAALDAEGHVTCGPGRARPCGSPAAREDTSPALRKGSERLAPP